MNQNNLQQINTQKSTSEKEHETYGLSMKFLKALHINLPLINRVFIGNIAPNVNEQKLREVFSYAGQIMQVFLINSEGQKQIAKIEYDHPVEAVQAIAMFNGQELYKRPLLVQLDTLRNRKNLPKGLNGFGPGLGPDGEPLRGVRMHVELQPIKTLLMQEINKLRQTISQELVVQPVQANSLDPNVVSPFMPTTTMNLNALLPMQNLAAFVNPQSLNNMQILKNFMQHKMIGNDNMAFMNMESQVMANQGTVPLDNAASVSDWSSKETSGNKQNDFAGSSSGHNKTDRLSHYDDRKRLDERETRKRSWREVEDHDDKPQINTDMLIFSNLPPSVTAPILNDKMREVGDVKFVELTGNGKALVRFSNSRDAERCLKLFNNSKVDGRIINVKLF